jgi:DNA-binding winged helix-turn-helix (wHTH) protein/tetratricopeptide (TPR) repeat protein
MSRPFYCFGCYRLDPAARELRRGNERVALPQKTLECLIYLVEHRDRAVGRSELIHAVWGHVHFSDAHLGKVIFQVRRAVGDSGDDQGLILTVPRFGYRWVAEVRLDDETARAIEPVPALILSSAEPSVQPATASMIPAAEPSSGIGRLDAPASSIATGPSLPEPVAVTSVSAFAAMSLWRSRTVAWMVVLLLVSIAAMLALLRRAEVPVLTASAPVAVSGMPDAMAVLPVTVDADASWAWLRLGLMDLIGNRLRGAGRVVVPSDNVVAAIRAASSAQADADAAEAVRQASDPLSLVQPLARRTETGWVIVLKLYERDGSERQVEAQGVDAIAAGQDAADRLLALMGGVPDISLPSSSDRLVEIIQRIEAALLADQLDQARTILAQAPVDLRDAPEMRLRTAKLAILSGQAGEADAILEDLLRQVPAETEPVLRARVLSELGKAAIHTERMSIAESRYSEVLQLLETRKEPRLLATAYMGRGISEVAQGRKPDALADFSRARVALQLAGDRRGLAGADANEAMTDLEAGRYAQAIPVLQRAAEQFRRFGVAVGEARVTGGLINAHLALMQSREALAMSDEAGPLLQRLEQPLYRGTLQSARAAAEAAAGRMTQARTTMREATAEARRSGVGTLVAVLLAQQARLELTMGDAGAALELAATAVATTGGSLNDGDRADAWLTLARAQRELHRDREAAAEVARFEEWAATLENVQVRWRSHLARAEQAWAERRRDEAQAQYEQAQMAVRATGSPADLLAVVDSYGRTLLADGELVRATAEIGQVARWADQDFDAALLQAKLYHSLRQREALRAALEQARPLAGERAIPASLAVLPSD